MVNYPQLSNRCGVVYCSYLASAARCANGALTDNLSLAPNTVPESIAIGIRLGELNSDPFVMAIANHAGGAITRAHVFFEKTAIQRSVAVNVPRPLTLLAPNVQAFI